MKPYSFVVLRYLHDASSQEFANVGIIMWVPEDRQLLFRLHDKYGRLSAFFPDFDGVGYRQVLRHLKARLDDVVHALTDGTQMRLMPAPAPKSLLELLHDVVGEDASCFRWSHAMGGLAPEPRVRFDHLMFEFVERHDLSGPRERHDEADIWTRVENRFRIRGLINRLHSGVQLEGGNYRYRFRTAWMNGVQQVMEPISLDYLNAGDVIEKATAWSGRLFNLSKGPRFQFTGVLAPPERDDLAGAYQQAVEILRGAPNVRQLVPVNEIDAFIPEIERDLAEHQ